MLVSARICSNRPSIAHPPPEVTGGARRRGVNKSRTRHTHGLGHTDPSSSLTQSFHRAPLMPWLNATTSQERRLSPPESPENHIRVRSPYRLRKQRASFAAPMPRSVGSGYRIHNVRSAIDMHPRGLALVLSRRGLGAYLAVVSVRHDESARVLLCKSLHAFILGRFRFGRVRVRARHLRFVLSQVVVDPEPIAL